MVAEFVTGFARVFGSERFGYIYRDLLERNPESRTALLGMADIHWRKGDWKEAVDYALRALWKSPHNFHMLSIISMCYGHLGDVESAYCYAKCVSTTRPPRWTSVRSAIAIVSLILLLFPRSKVARVRMWKRFAAERSANLTHLTWANELVAHHGYQESPNRAA